MSEPKHLGTFIRERREALKISLRRLATKAEISAPFLSDIEHGRRYPADEVRAKLAKALNVSAVEMADQDNRVKGDFKRWLEENPELRDLLVEHQRAGRPAEQLISAWRKVRKG